MASVQRVPRMLTDGKELINNAPWPTKRTQPNGSERKQSVIYFDRDISFFPLDSSVIENYRIGDNSSESLPDLARQLDPERRHVLTNGESYYVVPSSVLEAEPLQQPAALDLEKLQNHFFSDRAVEAALDVTTEAMESKDRGSLIYGTTGASSIYQALTRVAAGPNDRFLDIGCGCGLPVMVASHLVAQATGVDIVPSMIRFGTQAAAELGRSNARFVTANVRDLDIEDVDIVYVAATTLTEELRSVISEKLKQLKPGAVVISLTYALACDHLILIDQFKSPFAWWSTSSPTEHSFLIHLRRAA